MLHKDKVLYNQLTTYMYPFTSGVKLVNVWHKFCTQINESCNSAFSYTALKNYTYSRNMLPTSRTILATAINMIGYEAFFNILMQKIDIDMTSYIEYLFFRQGYRQKKNKLIYIHSPSTKQKEPKNTSKRFLKIVGKTY